MSEGATLPRLFVQDTGAEICMQASRLQQVVKAWVDAAFQNRAGDTDAVLQAIDGTVLLLNAMRDQIEFVREREAKKVSVSS